MLKIKESKRRKRKTDWFGMTWYKNGFLNLVTKKFKLKQTRIGPFPLNITMILMKILMRNLKKTKGRKWPRMNFKD